MAALELKGGDRLDAYLAKLAAKYAKHGKVRAGFVEGATYPDGTSVATVAAIVNFGAPGAKIPPRPFFSNYVRADSPSWGGLLAGYLRKTDGDVDRSLGLMGVYIAGGIRQAIVDMNSPPLSPITLMLRKMKDDDASLTVTGATVGEAARRVAAGEQGASGTRAKPLVDSGHMLASVDFEVVPS